MQTHADLSGCNTLALGSTAARLRVVRTTQELERLLAAPCREVPLGISSTVNSSGSNTSESHAHGVSATGAGLSWPYILGGGSNVILAPHLQAEVWQIATRGIVLEQADDTGWRVRAAAGEVWHDFVHYCLQQGWPGLENLALIPGTVGAAPMQNIGAYGLEVAERIVRVRAYDRERAQWQDLSAADCQFAYRDSLFKRSAPSRWVIAEVVFHLPRQWEPRLGYPDLQRWEHWPEEGPTPMAVFEAICQIRRAKLPDPAVLPNAGSFFKNPVVPLEQVQAWRNQGWEPPAWPQAGGTTAKVPAAWLIEQAGWKGQRLGPVGMHERHALVLVNYGGANASDVLRLAEAVSSEVQRRFGVGLEIEPVQML